jgi:hypothetical protein
VGDTVAVHRFDGAGGAETINRFRSVLTSTTKPPLPTLAMLGETIVHGQDIRLPLGIRHDYPIETMTRVAEYYQGTDLPVLTKKRSDALQGDGAATLRERCETP